MEHNGVCEVCNIATPCLESECKELPGHAYICGECLIKENKKPFHSYIDSIEPDVRFG